MEFCGKLGNYKIVDTEDGSKTIYSEFFDENCHSTAGAYEETLYNYIEGCEIALKLKEAATLTIYEVGFGAGLGPYALLKFLEENQEFASREIDFHSTELDPDFVQWVLKNSSFSNAYSKMIENYIQLNDRIKFKIKSVNFTIWLGDARESIKNYDGKLVDCIFQDAFSPKKNPALWSVEWFRDLYKISDEKVILSTYCSSKEARGSMILAGFYIQSRKGFAQKRTCTRAFKQVYRKQENLHIELERHNHPHIKDPT